MPRVILPEPGDAHLPLHVWSRQPPRKALEQLRVIARLPFVVDHVAAMPDLHEDLGCGMSAVRFDVPAAQLDRRTLERLVAAVSRRVPLGDATHRGAGRPLPDALSPRRCRRARWSTRASGSGRATSAPTRPPARRASRTWAGPSTSRAPTAPRCSWRSRRCSSSSPAPRRTRRAASTCTTTSSARSSTSGGGCSCTGRAPSPRRWASARSSPARWPRRRTSSRAWANRSRSRPPRTAPAESSPGRRRGRPPHAAPAGDAVVLAGHFP